MITDTRCLGSYQITVCLPARFLFPRQTPQTCDTLTAYSRIGHQIVGGRVSMPIAQCPMPSLFETAATRSHAGSATIIVYDG